MNLNWPEGTLETKFGNVHFARTQADHVSISTPSGDFIYVRGVYYHVHLHLYLIDGEWKEKSDSRLYIQRDWGDDRSTKPASVAARLSVIKELTRAWVEYEATVPEQAKQAERHKLNREFEGLRNAIVEQENDLDEKRKRLKTLLAALNKVGGRITT